MLYSSVYQDKDWPDGFEEIAWLTKQLKRYGYTVNIETKMFALPYGAPYRVTIIRWEHTVMSLKRIEIGTYEDKQEATDMIRFLLNVEDGKQNERT